jgi:hypothetical protein
MADSVDDESGARNELPGTPKWKSRVPAMLYTATHILPCPLVSMPVLLRMRGQELTAVRTRIIGSSFDLSSNECMK